MARAVDPPFAPVTRLTIAEQVQAQLESSITAGTLAPGDPVPAERALSEQFGVARTSVREALRGLAARGLVERRGNRMYVPELLPEVAIRSPEELAFDSRKLFVRQLFETRRVLELPITELAGRRASPEQRDDIRRAAARFWVGMPLDEFRREDRIFHSLIAQACGNPLLVEMYSKVLDALFRSAEFESLLGHAANRDRVDALIARACEDHRLIGLAFADDDAGDALQAAQRHLTNVENRMVDDLV